MFSVWTNWESWRQRLFWILKDWKVNLASWKRLWLPMRGETQVQGSYVRVFQIKCSVRIEKKIAALKYCPNLIVCEPVTKHSLCALSKTMLSYSALMTHTWSLDPRVSRALVFASAGRGWKVLSPGAVVKVPRGSYLKIAGFYSALKKTW